ncbi:MAG TPA: thiamine-phosphate kinase [Rhodocyclaceae bacterium]|nr:thiamine-phosphate kinase [Rhodocyclaceae bacterium]
MPSEFSLIERYFTRPARSAVLGVGDDCALLAPSPGQELAVSTDLLVAGTHFFADAEPEALGWKTLAVNVSDIAAMGGTPRWATLSLALPEATAADESWLAAFARGFFACAEAFGVELIGGDTTRGPLTLGVTIFGEVPAGLALRRSGARAGDDVWVSGTPGRAALGLAQLQGRIALQDATDCLAALHRPQPRVALGLALRNLASACIDVSDGLLADLGHILDRSNLAATLHVEALPLNLLPGDAPPHLARDCLLAGGDDYELAFTAASSQRPALLALTAALHLPLHRIGATTVGPAGDLRLLDAQGQALPVRRRGYDHFA